MITILVGSVNVKENKTHLDMRCFRPAIFRPLKQLINVAPTGNRPPLTQTFFNQRGDMDREGAEQKTMQIGFFTGLKKHKTSPQPRHVRIEGITLSSKDNHDNANTAPVSTKQGCNLKKMTSKLLSSSQLECIITAHRQLLEKKQKQ